jgi:hypothetical protein
LPYALGTAALGQIRHLASRCPGGWLVIANAVRSWHEASDFAKLITPELRRLETILLRMEDTDRASRIVFLPDPEHRWDGTSPAVAPAARIGG